MFKLILLFGLLGAQQLSKMGVSARPQVVGLRHPPEIIKRPSSSQAVSSGTSPATGGGTSKFVAKPGTIVANFDSNHEISKLSYVLQDGKLATLYQHRQQQSRSDPYQVPAGQPPAAAFIDGRQIDPDQSIDIVNNQMHRVSSLIGGDHVTIALPDELGQTRVGIPTASGLVAGDGEGGQQAVASLGSLSQDDKMDVLATIAVDVADAKLRKAGVFLDKLKGKVAQKLRQTPEIISAKLRAKSSPTQVILDRLGRNQVLEVDGSGQLATGIPVQGGQQLLMLQQQQPLLVPQVAMHPQPLAPLQQQQQQQQPQQTAPISAQEQQLSDAIGLSNQELREEKRQIN